MAQGLAQSSVQGSAQGEPRRPTPRWGGGGPRGAPQASAHRSIDSADRWLTHTRQIAVMGHMPAATPAPNPSAHPHKGHSARYDLPCLSSIPHPAANHPENRRPKPGIVKPAPARQHGAQVRTPIDWRSVPCVSGRGYLLQQKSWAVAGWLVGGGGKSSQDSLPK